MFPISAISQNKLILFIMMDLLPETIVNKFHKDEHNLECIDSINHVKLFKQHYDDIPRYTKPIYGDKFPHILTYQ